MARAEVIAISSGASGPRTLCDVAKVSRCGCVLYVDGADGAGRPKLSFARCTLHQDLAPADFGALVLVLWPGALDGEESGGGEQPAPWL